MASRTAGLAGMALVSAALTLAALAGCGGSGSSATTGGGSGTTAGDSGSSGTTTGSPDAVEPEPEAQSRRIKGESPNAEAATTLAIGAADCARLAAAAEARLDRKLQRESDPAPPLSKCRLQGHGATVNVFLDSGFAAHQRYENRMVETQQFGAPDPRKVPHPVADVGEKGAYDQNASWVPAYGSLFAVRGNRWCTVAYSVAGKNDREARGEAADLARLAFKLTAKRGTGAPSAQRSAAGPESPATDRVERLPADQTEGAAPETAIAPADALWERSPRGMMNPFSAFTWVALLIAGA